ncbi:MAG TPA: hypothetical protein VF157_06045, partial [Chloroflexota bacterium]
ALRRPGESELAWQTDVQPRYPTDRWAAGDAFRDWYAPVLPAQLPAGDYELLVGLGGPMASIGQVQVQELQRTFAAPAPEHPLKANLGGTIELLGYDQDRPSYKPGSTARIILYWQGAAPMTDSYTAFVHVLDAGQHVVAQVDSIPAHAQLPTTAWLPGQVVSDAYDLPLKADLPPGAYQLEVGFYRGDTGIRLKASSTDVRAIDDGLLIGTLTVSG